MRRRRQVEIRNDDLQARLPEGTLPDKVTVQGLALTGAQVAKIGAVLVGDTRLTIQRLRRGRVAVRGHLFPPGEWSVFHPDGAFDPPGPIDGPLARKVGRP
jgi:hypothetical protein